MRIAEPVANRLIANRIVTDRGCWVWTALLDHDGYSRISVGGKMRIGHRVAYEAFRGPIPPGLTLDHLCRNRTCINPDHLEPVTLAENISRGAHPNKSKTHCLRGHLFDYKNTKIDAGGWRQCRACASIRQKEARARRAYLDTFQALSPAARELAMLENKDARWSDADRRRYAELMRGEG